MNPSPDQPKTRAQLAGKELTKACWTFNGLAGSSKRALGFAEYLVEAINQHPLTRPEAAEAAFRLRQAAQDLCEAMSLRADQEKEPKP